MFIGAFFNTVSFSLTPVPEAVGVVITVKGLVTVSQDEKGNAFKGEVVLHNARVASTAGGLTTIRPNNGCVIDLKPNQAVTVDIRRECKAILASVQPGGVVVASAGGVGFDLGAVFTAVSFAQTSAPEIVGVVTRVEGLVTVSQGNTLGNAFKDEVILQNARVVTTASGSTTMRLKNGCVIDLKPNQAVTVDIRRECKAILASVQPGGVLVAGPGGAGFASAGGAGFASAGGAGFASAGGVGAVGVGSAATIGVGLASIGAINAISNSNKNSALQRLSGS